MCGIVGFTGSHQAAPILLDGLSKLEYRGYDSAGIAVRDGEELAQVVKATGRLRNLYEKTDGGNALTGTCGIGHTRWATHGEPTQTNAHPHVSGNCTGSASGQVESEVVGVHNGIIENYQELREKLLRHGYQFYSDTDTEVVIKLVDYYYKKYKIGPVDAIAKTMVRVRGSYALELMFRDYPGEIWVARKDSPMIIGLAQGETYVASDVPAILKYTRSVYYIGNLEFARLTPGEAVFYDLNGDKIQREPVEVTFSAEAAERGGFEHFMMKEIHEQPKAVADTLGSLIKDGRIDLSGAGLDQEGMAKVRDIIVVACGGEALPVCDRGSDGYLRAGGAGIGVSVQEAPLPGRYPGPCDLPVRRDRGYPGGIAAGKGERCAHAGDRQRGGQLHRQGGGSGPEIAVATTKAYSTQLIAGYCLAVQLGFVKGMIDEEAYAHYLDELLLIPQKIERLLEEKERIQWFAAKYANARDVFFIGRGIDYAVCLEGSLKLKEISYIHSEAYAAGELKHGTISLIEEGTLVIGLLTQSDLYEKTVSNMVECRSRGAYLMGLTTYGKYATEDQVNFTVYIPKIDEHFVGSLAVVPLQLLGYYISVARGLDVDKPRNLAKSVTVE